MTAVAPTLQAYFTQQLTGRRASMHTISSYRDSFRLLLGYAHRQLGKAPAALDFTDLDATFITGFLDHLAHERGNSVATCNARLAAIHSLFTFAALRHPEHADLIGRVLAIPHRHHDVTIVSYLTRPETDALLSAPDRTTGLGRRDHTLLVTAVQTGLRVSELTGLTCADVTLGAGAHVRCTGKGRKERATPLTRPTARLLAGWLRERAGQPTDPLFPARTGGRLSTDAISDLLAKHVASAARRCPSLTAKHVTPHTLRHTCAMNLLQAGVDTATIALWLGHAGTKATQIYLHADLAVKEAALARTA
ncbi:MAG TPA: tyrosine-type recombinase/integrase, partial [Kineosporiaceae bacterium]|nr:tyrosine-type recombinase/integrase [Kineosporiaceae bacterium]